MNKITVVDIRSLSYTGTTWINVLLGCHEKAFALGPPDRFFDRSKWTSQNLCRVHQANCQFWPDFLEKYDPSNNLFVELAKYSGKDIILINNPSLGGKAERHLKDSRVKVMRLYLVRDGRAVVCSYIRKNPKIDFYDAVKEWYLPAIRGFLTHYPCPPNDTFTYEDITSNQSGFIKAIGSRLGIKYPDNFYRFWEFDHHIIAGNRSVYGLIGYLGQQRSFAFKDSEFYLGQAERLRCHAEAPIRDERWRDELGPREQYIFDYFCGEFNARMGYLRENFEENESRCFRDEIEREKDTPHALSLKIYSPNEVWLKTNLLGSTNSFISEECPYPRFFNRLWRKIKTSATSIVNRSQRGNIKG